MDTALASELLQLERDGWSSLCSGDGADYYGALMTADGRMVLANGAVMTRDQVVESLREAPPWSSFSIDDPTVLRIDDDTAALVYRGTGHRDEGAAFVGVMSSVYTRIEDHWRLALYQQTPVVDGD